MGAPLWNQLRGTHVFLAPALQQMLPPSSLSHLERLVPWATLQANHPTPTYSWIASVLGAQTLMSALNSASHLQ